MYIAPGPGLTTPWGRNFDVNKFKKNLFKVWFYTMFFMILCMYIVPGQGQTAPRGQSFDVRKKQNICHVIHLLQVSK